MSNDGKRLVTKEDFPLSRKSLTNFFDKSVLPDFRDCLSHVMSKSFVEPIFFASFCFRQIRSKLTVSGHMERFIPRSGRKCSACSFPNVGPYMLPSFDTARGYLGLVLCVFIRNIHSHVCIYSINMFWLIYTSLVFYC